MTGFTTFCTSESAHNLQQNLEVYYTSKKQAGAELGQAQLKLELDFNSINFT